MDEHQLSLLDLPHEIIYPIFLSGLSLRDIGQLSATCKKIKALIDDDYFWKELYRQYSLISHSPKQTVCWKAQIKCCFDTEPENIYARYLDFPKDPLAEAQNLLKEIRSTQPTSYENYLKIRRLDARRKELEILAQYPEPPIRITPMMRMRLAAKKQTLQLIHALFGGQRVFNEFPQIELKDDEQFTVPCPYQISHKICRAVNKQGRLAVYIKYVDTNGNRTGMLVIQQVSAKTGDWCLLYNQNVLQFIPLKHTVDHAQYNIGIFLRDGVIVDTIAFQKLKELLGTLHNKFSYKSSNQYKIF